MTREELISLIYELTEVYDKLVCIVENCEYKETAQIIHETMNSVYVELEKHKGDLKHLVESNHDISKEVAEEESRNKEEFGWNGRIYEAALHEYNSMVENGLTKPRGYNLQTIEEKGFPPRVNDYKE